MAISRRSAEFRLIADEVHRVCARAGRLDVAPALVDRLLNAHLDHVAQLMDVQPRTALGYAPEDLAF